MGLALEHAESNRREIDRDLVVLVHRQAFCNGEHGAVEQPVVCRIDDIADHQSATDPERRRMIRMRFEEAVLPNLPRREGWHRIWISTTHNYDTPQFRLGLGYHFCTYEQLGREGWAVDQFRFYRLALA